jgi:DNA (cytosine-5)-methyltransferase 1
LNFKVIDLFAGAGGFSLGMEDLGCETSLCIDNDPHSLETLRQNKSESTKVLDLDLSGLDANTLRDHAGIGNEAFLLVGGPPCQPFSKNSYWTEKGHDAKFRKARTSGQRGVAPVPLSVPRQDNRRFLIDVYADAVRDAKPEAFVFENVASILHPRNKNTFDHFCERLKSYGYSVTMKKSLALSYGIPQKRERVFVLGLRGEHKPPFPPPTHNSRKSDPENLLPTPTVNEVLNNVAFKKEKGIEVKGRWAEALRQVPPGMNYKALTAWAGHPKPLFEAETRFWNFLLKLSPDLPSWTIASQPGPWTGPFHWDNRRLTTAEMAAIQGFPCGYCFSGPRRERVRQIGNAVPPKFVASVARGMLEMLG